MNTSHKVLHLSLMLAMTLPVTSALAISIDTSLPASANEWQNGIQIAEAKGAVQQFKNAGDADRLQHRVNEPVNDQAERSRLEKHDQKLDQLKTQDRLKTQDQLQDPDHLKDQDRLRDRDRLKDETHTDSQQLSDNQQMLQTQSQFQHRYQFENQSAGQGFNTSGSMYQRKGSGGSMGGGGSSAARGSSAGGNTKGGGSGRH